MTPPVNTRRVIVARETRRDPAFLADILDYDPETGALFWKRREARHFSPKARACDIAGWNTRHAGREAARILNSKGYVEVCIHNRRVCAHQVCFALYHGRWPSQSIDHIDGNRTNNRISNLREVSLQENARNMRGRADGRHFGVYARPDRGDWVARIRCGGRTAHLGVFATESAAIDARKRAERRIGFHENHGRVLAQRCATCGKSICGHRDDEWAGTAPKAVTIDESEPASWDRFFRQRDGEQSPHALANIA